MTKKEIMDIKTARQCLKFQLIKCNNMTCLNKVCPLNKFWDEMEKTNGK